MQEYYAMRDFLYPDGTKVFEKGHKYMGYRDGDELILIAEDDLGHSVGYGLGFVIIKDPKSDEITYQ